MEADASIVTSFDSDSAVIGQAVWEALLLFRSAPNLGSPKKRDWPAYRASGAKSVRAFEDQFVRVSVEAFPCVLRLEAVVLCRAANELFVGGFISNACEFNELGALIYQVSRSAIYVMEQEFG